MSHQLVPPFERGDFALIAHTSPDLQSYVVVIDRCFNLVGEDGDVEWHAFVWQFDLLNERAAPPYRINLRVGRDMARPVSLEYAVAWLKGRR